VDPDSVKKDEEFHVLKRTMLSLEGWRLFLERGKYFFVEAY
jgi:hypothetical protein